MKRLTCVGGGPLAGARQLARPPGLEVETIETIGQAHGVDGAANPLACTTTNVLGLIPRIPVPGYRTVTTVVGQRGAQVVLPDSSGSPAAGTVAPSATVPPTTTSQHDTCRTPMAVASVAGAHINSVCTKRHGRGACSDSRQTRRRVVHYRCSTTKKVALSPLAAFLSQ